MTSIEQLKRRADALAPGPAAIHHHYLSSADYVDDSEREAARRKLEQVQGNAVHPFDLVDGAHPGDHEGTVRVLWKGDV